MACWHCLKHKEYIDKEAAWRNQNKEMKENLVYKMISLTQEGDMADIYEKYGPDGVSAYCVEFMSMYLYNHGNGSTPHVIRETEYARWRHRTLQHNTVSGKSKTTTRLTDKELLSLYNFSDDPCIQFEDHQACWDLELRGGVGETAFHLCFLHSTPVYLEIAKVMLDLYPNLVHDIYEAEEYYGESALHFAIVHGDLEAVKLLVEKGANIHQRATGRFFLPEDQKKERNKKTNYEGYAYYGEYPLAFAACFGYESIYDYLISKGADPNLQDCFGNTVLHMTVVHNKPDMYSYAARHPVKKANYLIKNFYCDENKTNGDGLTPLALACTLGRQQIFEVIMELHKVELWRFSNVNCSLYPIHAVDSIGPEGDINWNSAMMITVNGNKDEHSEMLQGGVIRQLLDEKWNTYVKRRFFQRLVIVCCHLLILFIAVWMRPRTNVQLLDTGQGQKALIINCCRLALECLNTLFCLISVVMYLKEIKFLGFYLFFQNLKKAPFKAIYMIGCLLLLTLVPIRLTSLNYLNDPERLYNLQLIEEITLIIALPMMWTILLFFARVTKLVGPLINIILIYLKKDLLPFMGIVLVFLFKFDIAFHLLFANMEKEKNITTFASVPGAAMSLLQFTFGEFEYEEFGMTKYPELTMIVFLMFMILTPILLLNMLIAMMATTFITIIEKSERDWLHQWAKIIILLERTFSTEELLKFQSTYSVKIDKPPAIEKDSFDDKAQYNRGLMVIKSTRKTKAKQRHDAIKNWKRMAREVLNRIKAKKEEQQLLAEDIKFQTIFPNTLELSPRARSRAPSIDFTAAVEQIAWEKH